MRRPWESTWRQCEGVDEAEATMELLELRYGADSELANRKGEAPTLSAEPCRIQ